MSEMKRKKGKLVRVTSDGLHSINLQDYMEAQFSIYFDQEVTNDVAYGVLQDFFEEEDLVCPYYLFCDKLYRLEEEKDLDENGHIEASINVYGELEVDAHWYNGGASWSECVSAGLGKLEKEMSDEYGV